MRATKSARNTIKDVARVAGVSPATVARVVGNYGHVSGSTKLKVEKVVKELRYEPDAIARSMIKKMTNTIGLSISDVSNPFFTTLIRGVEDVANQNGYNLILCNSDEDPEKEIKYLQLLLSKRIDGLILAPTGGGGQRLKSLLSSGIPVVFVDRRIESVKADAVFIDNVAGAFIATEHLILSGYKRIAIISGKQTVMTGRDRLKGYLNAMQSYSLEIDQSFIKTGDFKLEGGRRAVQELMKLKKPPTAIFASNNLMTLGALLGLKEIGKKVPDDIAIVGFDDMDWAPLLDPPLTTIYQPAYTLGSTAAQILMQAIKEHGRRELQEVILKPKLIIRESCGCEKSGGNLYAEGHISRSH